MHATVAIQQLVNMSLPLARLGATRKRCCHTCHDIHFHWYLCQFELDSVGECEPTFWINLTEWATTSVSSTLPSTMQDMPYRPVENVAWSRSPSLWLLSCNLPPNVVTNPVHIMKWCCSRHLMYYIFNEPGHKATGAGRRCAMDMSIVLGCWDTTVSSILHPWILSTNSQSWHWLWPGLISGMACWPTKINLGTGIQVPAQWNLLLSWVNAFHVTPLHCLAWACILNWQVRYIFTPKYWN